MMQKAPFMRPLSHQIDTLARRQVPRVLPSGWEHRELTGRDYGVDMMVELFTSNSPTGEYLLLQIKGTEAEIDPTLVEIPFDVPANTLRYSELFVAPVLVVVCPVNAEPPICYYLWLQEYIRVVLNFEKPSWRTNKVTVRVHIPVVNHMPGAEEKLRYIASFPSRLFGLSNLGGILDRARYDLDGDWEYDTYKQILEHLQSIRDIPGLFDGLWPLAEDLKSTYLDPTIKAVENYLQGTFPSDSIDEFSCFYEAIAGRRNPDHAIRSQVRNALDNIAIMFNETDYRFKHDMWSIDKYAI